MVKIFNACIWLMVKDNKDIKVLMTNEQAGIGTPGGKIEKNESCWKCMKREFKEETGYELPELYKYEKIRDGCTLVYIASTMDHVSESLGEKHCEKIKKLKLVKISTLKKVINNEIKMGLRSCTRRSAINILNKYTNGLNHFFYE